MGPRRAWPGPQLARSRPQRQARGSLGRSSGWPITIRRASRPVPGMAGAVGSPACHMADLHPLGRPSGWPLPPKRTGRPGQSQAAATRWLQPQMETSCASGQTAAVTRWSAV